MFERGVRHLPGLRRTHETGFGGRLERKLNTTNSVLENTQIDFVIELELEAKQ